MKTMIEYWLLRKIVGAVNELSEKAEEVFRFKKEGLVVRGIDSIRSTFFTLEIPAAVFSSYEPESVPLKIGISGKQGVMVRLGGGRGHNIVTLITDMKTSNQLKLDVAGQYGHRVIGVPVLDLEESDIEPEVFTKRAKKELPFEVRVKAFVDALLSAVTDTVRIGGVCNIEARQKPERFVIWNLEKGTFNSSWSEFEEGLSMMALENISERVKTAMDANRVIRILKAGAYFTDVAKLEFATDFPIKFTFQLPFEGLFQVILAPRIEPD